MRDERAAASLIREGQTSLIGHLVRGRVGVTSTAASRLLFAFQKPINRFANQPGNRNIFSDCNLCQLSKLFRLQPYGC
jgi:hypothetical protein